MIFAVPWKWIRFKYITKLGCRNIKSLQLAPGNRGSQLGITVMYSLLGREEEACAAAKKVLEMNPKFSLEGASKALPFKNEADLKVIVDALRKAGLK